MNSKMLNMQRSGLVLTARQREILVGTLLGDGHLETQDEGKTYRLKIEHAWKQKAYVDWMSQEWNGWINTPPQTRTRELMWKGEKRSYTMYWFNTLSAGSLRFFAHQFYRQKEKVVPKQIRRWLTPLALAVWYMDDGSIKSRAHRTVFLNTQGFDGQSLERLQEALLKRYGIHTSLRVQSEGKQIYLRSETVDIFLSLIHPFILPSMRYKLPTVWLTPLPKK